MAKAKSTRTGGRARAGMRALDDTRPLPAQGAIVAGYVELAPAPRGVVGTTESYSVRLTTGDRVVATLSPSVCPEFVKECLREGRLVLLVAAAGGYAIAGALQTARQPTTDARGTLTLDAERMRLRAKRSLTLEVASARLELEPSGLVRLEGDRLVIDAAALVRILSGKVEIP